MEEGRDFGPLTICLVVKGSFSNYKLNVYVVGSIPTSQTILSCGSPSWLGQNITEPCLFDEVKKYPPVLCGWVFYVVRLREPVPS
jgi:hypothetical protein